MKKQSEMIDSIIEKEDSEYVDHPPDRGGPT